MRDKEFNKASEPAGAIEPEFITIVEGPPPVFQQVQGVVWPYSLAGGTEAHEITTCQTRTLKGTALIERCRRAWEAGRPVLLDFPDEIGLRRQLEVVAIRYEELPAGTLLHVWTRDDD